MYELYLIYNNAFQKDFLNGFTKNPKTLMSKYFYDDRGSTLFSKIIETDEYYLTRVEQQIFHDNISDIASFIPDKSIILDYGGADTKKFSFLFPYLKNPIGYLPIDISDNYMQYNIYKMQRKCPNLIIKPIHSDFTKPIIIPSIDKEYNNVVGFFLGSSLGNFPETELKSILTLIKNTIGENSLFVVGIDLVKDPEILLKAYNDENGITSDFNKNLLYRANNEINANFRLDQFEHKVIFNQMKQRIEMYLVAKSDMNVNISGEIFSLKKDEEICTEYSHKYTVDQFTSYCTSSGFSLIDNYVDENEYYSVLLLN